MRVGLWLLLALMAISACQSKESGRHFIFDESGPLDAGPDSGMANAGAGSNGDAADAASVGSACEPSTLVAPVQLPWVPNGDDSTCEHVEVVKDCTNGWCRIPAGCFVMGSPEDEPGRAMRGEELTTVRLTRGFEIGQFEVTRAEWAATGWALPQGELEGSGVPACDAPDCPMTRVSWFAAMHYANWLSEHAEPPLAACYTLAGCTGSPEYQLICESVTVNTASEQVYDCEGYRLPTEPEWEYAARAGSRTAYLTGPMSDEAALDIAFCLHEAALDDYAWYCLNAPNGTMRHAGCKGANAWGLHDVLGNASEWVSNPEWSSFVDSLPTDPWGEVDATLAIGVRGGNIGGNAMMLRLARGTTWRKQASGIIGFRLVRTLPPEESP